MTVSSVLDSIPSKARPSNKNDDEYSVVGGDWVPPVDEESDQLVRVTRQL